ncbi:MAG: hypothetical protein HYW71_00360 [Candidatus Niyogibacteria bacterium]|nr:hypothetical protein [Candidatus Niyogibacteria bacterium]
MKNEIKKNTSNKIKLAFFLGRRFTYIGHTIAILLKERHGLNNFCAYVAMRSGFNFLKSQKDIQYNQLFLAEDVFAKYKNEKIDLDYIKSLEHEFGLPSLWPYIVLDRVLISNLFLRAYPSDTPKYSHEDMLKIFQVIARTVIEFFDKEKPNFILFSAITDLGTLLLYEAAKKRNIKTLFICSVRIDNFYILSERYDNYSDLNELFIKMRQNMDSLENQQYKKMAKNFLISFQNKPTYYVEKSKAASYFLEDYASLIYHFRFLSPFRIGQTIRWFLKTHYDYFINKAGDRDDFTTKKPWWEAWDKLVRKIRVLVGYGDLYDKEKDGEDYAYFALHLEPESLPTLVAPFYTDQKWLIKQIARSLPVHYKLYVKDHSKMLGLRTRSYYKELKKNPNVKLIDPAVSSFELIKKSKLVINIVGTASLEAALMKKPVIMFGNIFFDKLSMVKICHNIQDLPSLIKSQLENSSYDNDELIAFLMAIYKESAAIDFVQLWSLEGGSRSNENKQKLIPFVDLIAKKLKID